MVEVEVKALGRTSRARPQAVADGSDDEQIRLSRYGESYGLNPIISRHLLADEGVYHVVQNPTTGTGVAHALTTAFSATSGLFVIKNNLPVDDGRRLWLDYLRLILTAAPAGGVSLEFLVALDNVNRVPTAGHVERSATNVNMDAGADAGIQVWAFNAGALTVPAAGGSVRHAARVRIPTGVNVVGDEYVVQLGGVSHLMVGPPLTAIRAAQPARLCGFGPPVGIGPQQFAVIHRWSLTEITTAPSYEYELGLFLR